VNGTLDLALQPAAVSKFKTRGVILSNQYLKFVPRWAHVLALLSFLLPFVQVSCGGAPLARLTGVNLALGTGTISSPNMMPGSAPSTAPAQKVPLNGYVTVSFLAAIVAVGASFACKERAVAMVSGSLTALSLLGAYARMPSKGMITIDLQVGFYLALLLSCAGAGIAAYLRFTKASPEDCSRDLHSSPTLRT
jgi:hypothetical protein